MSIATSIRRVFAPNPELQGAEAQRAELLDRRDKLQASAAEIDRKKRPLVAELATLDGLPGKAEAAESAFAEARVAAGMGQTLPVALEVLAKAAQDARKAEEAARGRAIDLRAMLAAYERKAEPLPGAQQANRAERVALVPAVLGQRLVALKPRYDEAVAALNALVEEMGDIVRAHDDFATRFALGSYWGAQQFDFVTIPVPNHQAFVPVYDDVFARGRAITAEHEAFREKLKDRDARRYDILREAVDG